MLIRSIALVSLGAALSLCCVSTKQAAQWRTIYTEDFQKLTFEKTPTWRRAIYDERDPYSDNGEYFHKANPTFTPPQAFRISATFGENNWLTVESYSRSKKTAFSNLFGSVSDPENPSNPVLQIQSLKHTDGTVVRPSKPLPPQYRVCVRVGFADFGSGRADDGNGYLGEETPEPWFQGSSVNENGFYWLTILDHEPRPRNNVWIHHHRKVVIDSDNNSYPEKDGGSWSHIWNGSSFSHTGEHPIMMFALDTKGAETVWNYDRTGQPFIAYASGQWNYERDLHQIRAVDAYKPKTWYKSCIEKNATSFVLSVEGDFQYGGKRRYSNAIPLSEVYQAHAEPEYFMFGDPHVNFYRGKVLYDDLTLEVPTN